MAKPCIVLLIMCVEIPTLLLYLSFTITNTMTRNFIMYRTCYATLGYDKSACENIGTRNNDNYTQELEDDVGSQIGGIMNVHLVTTQIIPATLTMFFGPWSDKHGRKPMMILAMIGFCTSGVCMLIVVLVESSSPWWLMFAFLALTFTGGAPSYLTAAIGYVADVTRDKNRGMRFGIFEGAIATGTLLGIVSHSYLFERGRYNTVFGIALGSYFLATFYSSFFMIDSRRDNQKEPMKKNVFSLMYIKSIMHSLLKPRKNYLKVVLILMVVISTFLSIVLNGDHFIAYPFLREKLNWDFERYALYQTIGQILRVVSTIGFIALLHKMLKIQEMPLILLGSLAMFVSMIIQAVASEDWHIYLAGTIKSLCGPLVPMTRSYMSKIVGAHDEMGRVFSLTVAHEIYYLAAGRQLYYLLQLDENPGAYNYLGAGFCGVIIASATAILILQRMSPKEDIPIEGKEAEESQTP